jgi:hypothetical protein
MFSDMVIVKIPPRSGTSLKMWARLSEIHWRTFGTLVHMVKNWGTLGV